MRRLLDRLVDELEGRIREALGQSATSLTEIFGVGPLLGAKKIMGRVGTITRLPSRGHFATYTGTAPVEVSSGDVVVRQRLSRAGERKLNAALHITSPSAKSAMVRRAATTMSVS